MSARPSSAARFLASCRSPSPPNTSLRSVGRLAALRAVGLVDNNGATPGGERSRAGRASILGHLEQLARDERELLQCGDDHRHGILKRFGELS